MVDGCSRMGVLIRIVLPVSIPGIVCAVLFAFTLAWNEFIYAYSFISSSTQKVVAPGVLTELIRGDVFHWGEIRAGAFVGALPIVIFYVFFLDDLIRTSEVNNLRHSCASFHYGNWISEWNSLMLLYP